MKSFKKHTLHGKSLYSNTPTVDINQVLKSEKLISKSSKKGKKYSIIGEEDEQKSEE